MIFSDTPKIRMGAKVAITDMGIEIPTIKVAVKLRKKTNKTIIANIPPITAVDFTSLTAFSINID
jgi:hypothetical protein